MKTGRGHNESRLHGIRKACARRSNVNDYRREMLPAYAASKGGVVELTRSLARHDDGIEVRVLIFQRVREIAQNAAAAVGEVVATDAAVVDSVATTAMRMSFEQAQLGANVTDPLLSRRRWPNGPGTEGDRIRGKWGAPQSACYGHATGGLSAYYPGRIFHRHRHLSGPDFQDLVRLFPT